MDEPTIWQKNNERLRKAMDDEMASHFKPENNEGILKIYNRHPDGTYDPLPSKEEIGKLIFDEKCMIELIQSEIAPIYRKYRGRPEVWHEALRCFIQEPIDPERKEE